MNAIVVVNYGSSALLAQHLTRLTDEVPDFQVVVVDSFSDDAEQTRMQELCAARGWRAVPLDTNVGFGAGVNRGATVALELGADALLILNPDAVITGDAARALVDAASSDPGALVAPVVLRPDGSIWSAGMDVYLDDGSLAGVRFRDRYGDRPRRMWISGACLAVSEALWHKVAGFDEDYFMYWEDVDLSHKVVASGGRLIILDSVSAVHDEGGTQVAVRGLGGRSELFYYYNLRNRMLYARKHLDDETIRRWQRSALRKGLETIRGGGGRSQFVRSVAPLRALARGLRDGLQGSVGR